MTTPNFLVCLSGGIDSTTVLADIIANAENYNVKLNLQCIIFKYPSKHNKLERKAAFDVAQYYNIPIHVVDVCTLFENSDSSLIAKNKKVPEGHYAEKTMASTVVPLRNIIFSNIAASFGIELFKNEKFILTLGVHSGDHAIYSDCRPETITALALTLKHSSDNKVLLAAPFLLMDKAQIVSLGINLKVPYHLTRTCYTKYEMACGKCGSCIERLEAFAINNAIDRIIYNM